MHDTKERKKVHRMFTWKTQTKGKNHGSPQAANYHYARMYNSEFTEATTSCSRSSPQVAVTTEAATSFSLSLSIHCYVLSLLLAPTRENDNNNSYYMFALSHIYTNLTFRQFTNIALMGSQKHIYEYVSSSGLDRVCTIRLSVAGDSSSGSHRVCTIRLSVARYSSSGSP